MNNFALLLLILTLGLFACENDTEPQKKIDKIEISQATDTPSEAEIVEPVHENLPIDLDIQKFVPRNHAILDSTKGDLNLDGIDDVVLVLKKINEEETSDMSDVPGGRPLLLLIGQKDGTLKLKRQNDNTVYCYDCGGIFGDPFDKVVIKNGYFSVEHYGGSNWRWTKVVTFNYSKTDNEWYLHKDGGDSFHTSDPENIKTTVLTTKDFGVVKFEDYNIIEE